MRILAGTSGFSYKEWKGSFYPDDLPAAQMLAFYAARFPVVEINNTFYRMPTAAQLEQWAAQVPDSFSFVLKAPQRITHRKRLREVGEDWAYFTQAATALGDRLGPLLVQLPPNLKADAQRLADFLSLTTPEQRVALEFRHPSWLDERSFALLREHEAALCITHGELEQEVPLVATASWGYVRLRNVEYTPDELHAWATRLRSLPCDPLYVFFKHEDSGTGPRLAADLMTLLS